MGTWHARAKRRMQDLGVTQMDLLSVFDVTTRGAVGHYLNGRRDPSPSVLTNLADKLDMSLDELLRGRSALTPKERELLENYRSSNASGRDAIERNAKLHAQTSRQTALNKEA